MSYDVDAKPATQSQCCVVIHKNTWKGLPCFQLIKISQRHMYINQSIYSFRDFLRKFCFVRETNEHQTHTRTHIKITTQTPENQAMLRLCNM